MIVLSSFATSINTNSISFDGSGDSINFNNDYTGINIGEGTDYTIEFWFKSSYTTVGQKYVMGRKDDSVEGSISITQGTYGAGILSFNMKSAEDVSYHTDTGNIADNNWHFIAMKRQGTNISIFVDSVMIDSDTIAGTHDLTTSNPLYLGAWQGVGTGLFTIDEFRYWSDIRTQQELMDYNNTEITGTESNLIAYYKFNEGSGTTTADSSTYDNNGTITNANWEIDVPFNDIGLSFPFSKVKITNKWNSSNLENVNVTLSNGLSNLTNINGIASFNITGNLNFNATLNNYFLIIGVTSENNTIIYNISQSEISFDCYEKITNNSLTCVNNTIYPNANIYNFTIGVNNYYDVTQEETITALDNKTISFNNFYSSNLTFLNNFITGPGNDNTSCLYNIEGVTYPSFNEVVNGSNASTIGLINGSYTIIVDCLQYAYSYANVTITETTQNVTFDLYTTNSIDIFIFDETTGLLINTTNITITKILGVDQEENITSTGTISYMDLIAGNYTFDFAGEFYPSRTYTVTIGNKTYQTLNVYLLANSTDAVIFNFQEFSSNVVIEGVTLQISKIINGTDTLIAVLTSDITGNTQFYFDTIGRYCFVASKTNYQSKSFCLNPIIFSSYKIRLETSVDLSTGDDYEEILIEFTPKRYWNNQNNTITFTFANPKGALTNYGFNATYNFTTVTASGTNAYGGTITQELEITGAEYGDKVILEYYYKKSGDSEFRTFKEIYEIYGYSPTQDSLLDNPPDDYGLGEFEKTLISVSITLLVAGASAFYGGPLAGGVMALFIMAYLMYVSFLNFWVGIISIILLFIVVTWRSQK